MTRYHGPMEYGNDTVVRFDRGLPGFEGETDFLPIEVPSARPVVFLQSISTPGLCFVSLPVTVIDPEYSLTLSEDCLEAIGWPPDGEPRVGEDVLCLAMLTIEENGPTTANLMAPLILDLQRRRGMQMIREDGVYSHRQPFLESEVEALCS
jgi:flagellar assembly factor FliW